MGIVVKPQVSSIFNNVVIHQPNLFPNIKVLQKICAADIWVVLDDAQFVRREWQNRCKLRDFKKVEEDFWLTASVSKACQQEKIKNIKFKEFSEFKNHTIFKLKHTYGKSSNWEFIEKYLREIFKKDYLYLSDFCVDSILTFFEMLDIKLYIAYSSEYKIEHKRTGRLIEICKVFKATKYISGLGGKNYMDTDLFKNENIQIEWHEWEQPQFGNVNDSLDWWNYSFIDFVARYKLTEIKKYLQK